MPEEEDDYKGPWEASYVQCDLCEYRWTAVFPAGLERLECANCGNMATFECIETED